MALPGGWAHGPCPTGFSTDTRLVGRGPCLPTVVPAGSRPLTRPTAGALPRNRLALSAAGGASAILAHRRAGRLSPADAAGSRPLTRPTAGALPRNRLALSAAGGASAILAHRRAGRLSPADAAGSRPLTRPTAGALPRNRLALSAAGGASAISS